jgi:hypothetical protein
VSRFTLPKFDFPRPDKAPSVPEAVPLQETPIRAPDSPKIVPKAPNLVGDDAMFARYDPATGELLNVGHMHREHIEAETKAGAAIVEHDDHTARIDTHKLDLTTRKLVPYTKPRDIQAERDLALVAISQLLIGSDKYFTSDATDNITPQEQAQWRNWRKALRAAAKLDDPDALIAAVPKTPKGIDLISHLRKGKASPP